MSQSQLSELQVLFTAKGVEAVESAMGRLTGLLGGLAKGIDAVGKSGDAFLRLGNLASGWVRAGYQGTVQAEALNQAFARLGRGIASTTLPQMESLIGGVQRAAQWFDHLDGGQQRTIGTFLSTGAASVALARGLSMVLGPLGPIGIAFSVITGAMLSTEKGRSALGRLGESLAKIGQSLAPILDIFTKLGAVAVEGFAGAIETIAAKLTVLLDKIKEAGDWLDKQTTSANGRGKGLFGENFTRALKEEFTNPDRMRTQQELIGTFLTSGGDKAAVRAKMLERFRVEQGTKQAAAARAAGKDQSHLSLARTGTENLGATIGRLQQASLKADLDKKIEDNTRWTAEGVAQLVEMIRAQFSDNIGAAGAGIFATMGG